MTYFTDISAATDFIFKQLGSKLRLTTPLGLGKPNELLNSIYSRVAQDPALSLNIYTALSLNPPEYSEELGQRFFEPFKERHWGNSYPELYYFKDASQDLTPANIQVHEFYFQAGAALASRHLQTHYQSVNYTHVAENILRREVNVVVQMIAKKTDTAGRSRYSLSCNPDLTLDVADLYRSQSKPLLMVGVIHPDLPFLEGESEVEESFFTAIVEPSGTPYKLFALPRMPVSLEDHLIGYYSSLLVMDQGTLQIGIGTLSEAVVGFLILRHTQNSLYLKLFQKFASRIQKQAPDPELFHSGVFSLGLYGLTEMLTDGFMHLRKAGILKRYVTDEQSGQKTYVHGSFYLGSKVFYQWLRELSGEEAQGLRMTRVSKVNDLYDPKETLLRQQRTHARFFNTTMQMSLLGEAMSDTLIDGRVVSGVGGQYNFVAMSHELKKARSVLMLRSTRIEKNGRRVSNIVWTPGHITVPRHLRDLVVTEYGIADLRGKSDEECIQALLSITDSAFQQELLKNAKASRKISESYQIPTEFKQNNPESLRRILLENSFKSFFKPFPFGSDFSAEEEKLILALQALQEDQKVSLWKVLKNAAFAKTNLLPSFEPELKRMGLAQPKSLKERLYRRLLLHYLQLTKT